MSPFRRVAQVTAWILCVVLASISLQGQPESTVERMNRFVDAVAGLDLSPGMAIAVVQEGKLIYSRGVGYADLRNRRPVDEDTLFYIASSTKSFTGLAAALLAQRGVLDLDGSLQAYLPELKLASGLDPARITLRQLLTHTHGIDNDGPVTFRCAYSGQHTPELLIRLLAEHPPAEKGTQFRYGNLGYNVASLVLDRVAGRSWKELLEAEIFGPLGMSSTSAYRSRVDPERLALPYKGEPEGFSSIPYSKGDANMHAAGGIITSIRDLASWLKVNTGRGMLDGKRVLPEAIFAEAHRPQVEQDDSFGEFRRTGYGLGWNTGPYLGEDLVHHFGGYSGFHAHVSFMPKHSIGVAVLSNSVLGTPAAGLIARYAYETLLGTPGVEDRLAQLLEETRGQAATIRRQIAADRSRRAARPQVLNHPLEAFAGSYENPAWGRVELRVAGDHLEAEMGLVSSVVEVFDGKKNQLRVELTGSGAVVQVEFEGNVARALSVSGIRYPRVP